MNEETATTEYRAEDLLCLARRYHNAKRSYLLVNRRQAKHLPSQPKEALLLMRALGEKIRAAFPDAHLIVAFAETATAVGLMATEGVGGHCLCLTTTREAVAGVADWIEFREEHSHATEQRLDGASLRRMLAETQTVVFLDDELSTGKTIRNMVQALSVEFPELAEKTLVAASIFYRLDAENEAKMAALGITPVYLVRLPQRDYEAEASAYTVAPAAIAPPLPAATEEMRLTAPIPLDPRTGVVGASYIQRWRTFAWKALHAILKRGAPFGRVLVLGTEECMLPALLIARAWDAAGYEVRCHATTRSPIGVSTADGYPIREGWQLPSFYDDARMTYIYNLDRYDLVVVVTDAPAPSRAAEDALRGALAAHDCGRIVWIRTGEQEVLA